MSQFQSPTHQDGQLPQYTSPQETYSSPQTPLQSAPPPRKRMSRGSKVVLIFLAVLLVFVTSLVIGIVVKSGSVTPTVNTAATVTSNYATVTAAVASNDATVNAGLTAATDHLTQTAMTPTAIPTMPVPTTSQTGVGSTQFSGVWTITVNSIKTVVSSNEFEVPKTGDEFIAINFTAVNTETAAHEMNPFYFTLRDDSGTSYDLNPLTIAANPDGTVVGGQKLRGDLTYEIPNSMHSLTLQFDTPDDLDNSQIIQWDLTL